MMMAMMMRVMAETVVWMMMLNLPGEVNCHILCIKGREGAVSVERTRLSQYIITALHRTSIVVDTCLARIKRGILAASPNPQYSLNTFDFDSGAVYSTNFKFIIIGHGEKKSPAIWAKKGG